MGNQRSTFRPCGGGYTPLPQTLRRNGIPPAGYESSDPDKRLPQHRRPLPWDA